MSSSSELWFMDLPLIEVHRVGALQNQYCFLHENTKISIRASAGYSLSLISPNLTSPIIRFPTVPPPASRLALVVLTAFGRYGAEVARRDISRDRPSLHSKGSGAPAKHK